MLDYYLSGAVKDKCYADMPKIIDALKDNIREAIGEIQPQKLDLTCRLPHDHPRQPFECNYFPLLTGRIVLSNRKRNLKFWLIKRKARVRASGQISKRKYEKYFFGDFLSAGKNSEK